MLADQGQGLSVIWRLLRSDWTIRNVWQSSGSYLMDKTGLDSLSMFPLGSKQSAVTWDIMLTIGLVNSPTFTSSLLSSNISSSLPCLKNHAASLGWVLIPIRSRLDICQGLTLMELTAHSLVKSGKGGDLFQIQPIRSSGRRVALRV